MYAVCVCQADAPSFPPPPQTMAMEWGSMSVCVCVQNRDDESVVAALNVPRSNDLLCVVLQSQPIMLLPTSSRQTVSAWSHRQPSFAGCSNPKCSLHVSAIHQIIWLQFLFAYAWLACQRWHIWQPRSSAFTDSMVVSPTHFADALNCSICFIPSFLLFLVFFFLQVRWYGVSIAARYRDRWANR